MKRERDRTKVVPGDSSLASRLQSLRWRRGWNMDRVAAAAGISRTTLFHLERNKIDHPRASTLHKLARVFDVPIESLTGTVCEAPRADGGMDRSAGERHNADVVEHPPFHNQHGDFRSSGSAAFDRATNPIVTQVAAERPELFVGWSPDDWDELYSQFATGGALREEGVQATASRINHDREILYRLRIVLQTHLADVASGMVDTLYKLVSIEPTDEPTVDTRAADSAMPDA